MPAKPKAVGYCRTSSESQRDNTSIPNQKEVIQKACDLNGWQLTKFYVDESKSGKSIAGRDAFQQMMRDAAAGKFDKVVSLDVKRFGRNGLDILQSANTLKREFGIDYIEAKGGFETKAGSGSVMVNFVQAGIAEQERLLIKERTAPARRRKARETGAPTWGRRLFGRNWTGEKWEVDEKQKQIVSEAARKYLNGESLRSIAKEVGMTAIHGILRDKCGDTITVHFKEEPEIGLPAEDIEISVPRLLPQRTINLIHKRLDSNRTRPRGHKNDNFLFSRLIFCGVCKRALTPQDTNNVRYYRPCGCKCLNGGNVNANQIEEIVIRMLFEMFGNPTKLQQALDRAIPNKKRLAELETKRDKLIKDQARVKSQIDRLVDAIVDDLISKKDAKQRRMDIAAKETKIQDELDLIEAEIASAPTRKSKYAPTGVRYAKRFDSMSFEDKKALASFIFSGKSEGNGIFIHPTDNPTGKRPRPWRFTLKGTLVDHKGRTDSDPINLQLPDHSDYVSQLASS